jgi:hypothetical protein
VFNDYVDAMLAAAFVLVVIATVGYAVTGESWSRKSEQDDKWSFCLIAGTLCPANQERQ